MLRIIKEGQQRIGRGAAAKRFAACVLRLASLSTVGVRGDLAIPPWQEGMRRRWSHRPLIPGRVQPLASKHTEQPSAGHASGQPANGVVGQLRHIGKDHDIAFRDHRFAELCDAGAADHRCLPFARVTSRRLQRQLEIAGLAVKKCRPRILFDHQHTACRQRLQLQAVGVVGGDPAGGVIDLHEGLVRAGLLEIDGQPQLATAGSRQIDLPRHQLAAVDREPHGHRCYGLAPVVLEADLQVDWLSKERDLIGDCIKAGADIGLRRHRHGNQMQLRTHRRVLPAAADGRHRSLHRLRPVTLLKVTHQHQLPMRLPRRIQRFLCQTQPTRRIQRHGGSRQPGDGPQGWSRVAAHHVPGTHCLAAEGDHRQLCLTGKPVHDSARRRLRLLPAPRFSIAVACLPLHREAGVEQEHRGGAATSPADRCGLHERPCHADGQHNGDQAPQQKQQQRPPLDLPSVLLVAHIEQVHRRPVDRVEPRTIEQVNAQRHHQGCRAQQKHGVEKAHQTASRRLRKRASSSAWGSSLRQGTCVIRRWVHPSAIVR